jgi:hypothetical protein
VVGVGVDKGGGGSRRKVGSGAQYHFPRLITPPLGNKHPYPDERLEHGGLAVGACVLSGPFRTPLASPRPPLSAQKHHTRRREVDHVP